MNYETAHSLIQHTPWRVIIGAPAVLAIVVFLLRPPR